MAYLKNVFKKNQIIFAIIAIACLLVSIITIIISVNVTKGIKDQGIADRWSDNNDFSQISCFFSPLAAVSEDTVKGYLYEISNKLQAESLLSSDESIRNYIYTYSSTGTLNIASGRNEVKVKAMGVAGDYFLFHPETLISGSYFDSDDIMDDRVILDRETAFNLFGSSDVVGQMVEISGVRHIVSGVFEKESGYLTKLAGNDEPLIYVSYGTLQNYGYVNTIDSLEILIPSPVSGYGKEIVEGVVKLDESRYSILENTGRYNFVNLLKLTKEIFSRSMNKKGFIYPYYENVARAYEDIFMRVTLITVIILLVPCGYLLYIMRRMWIMRTIHFSDIKKLIDNAIDDRRRKKRLKEESYEESI